MKKIIAILLTLIIAGSCLSFITGCNNAGNAEASETMKQEKEYIYLWWNEWLAGRAVYEETMKLQAPGYAMRVDPRGGSISSLGHIDYSENYFVETDFSALPSSSMQFSYEYEGAAYKVDKVAMVNELTSARLIENGRYATRMDIPYLNSSTDSSEKYGRLEIFALQDYFTLTYDMFTATEVDELTLSFTLDSAGYNDIFLSIDGYSGYMRNNSGKGFAFYLPEEYEGELSYTDTGVKFSAKVRALANKNTGFSVVFIPSESVSQIDVANFKLRESVQFTVTQKFPYEGRSQAVTYESGMGLFDININEAFDYDYGFMVDENVRKNYERMVVKAVNPTDKDIEVPIMFNKYASDPSYSDSGSQATTGLFSVMGMSPFIRDMEGYPTGQNVQLSKNWHYLPLEGNLDAPDRTTLYSPLRMHEGYWMHMYTTVTIPANGEIEFEYTCAYSDWGGVPSASHAQLSIVGWGKYTLWEEMALGSYGENYVLNPDRTVCSFIADVRPVFVAGEKGGNLEYNWTGNSGGGEYLIYSSEGEKSAANMRVNYVAHSPNMTDAIYDSVTEDGKIKANYRINLGRTDDVVRNYITLRYEFLEDTVFNDITFYSIAALNYAVNHFQNLSFGDSSGIIENRTVAELNMVLDPLEVNKTYTAPGDDPWFAMYNTSYSDEDGTLMFTVREYNAVLNGKQYTSPTYKLKRYNRSNTDQILIALTTPEEVGKKIKKGSVVELTIEHAVLPLTVSKYYGPSDYLNSTLSIFNTAEAALYQAKNNKLTAKASVGSIRTLYPLEIDTVSGSVAAQFKLSGGLGYTPLVFYGLNSYKGYKLQMNINGTFVDVDQSVHGNDFWQTDYMTLTSNYRLIYNVKNSSGIDHNITNEYRLVRE